MTHLLERLLYSLAYTNMHLSKKGGIEPPTCGEPDALTNELQLTNKIFEGFQQTLQTVDVYIYTPTPYVKPYLIFFLRESITQTHARQRGISHF